MTSLQRALSGLMAAAVAVALMGPRAALADDYDDCRAAIGDWQPRDRAVSQIESLGIEVDRLKIDDGCYEMRGRDSDGNRVRLKLDPASLAWRELKVVFRAGSDPARYLAALRGEKAAPVSESAPEGTAESAPQTKENRDGE